MPIGSFYSHREEAVSTYAAATSPSALSARTGLVGIAHPCRYYDHDDQRILARYGYT